MKIKAVLISVLLFVCLAAGCTQDSSAQKAAPNADVPNNAKSTPQKSPAPVISPLPKMKNPSLVAVKNERKLYLYDGEKLVKTYKIGLGFAPEGDKEIEGDGKTPEGEFYIFTKNPKSSFYLSLGISYPNLEDARRGLEGKLITQAEYDQIAAAVKNKKTPPQKTKLGGEIYIHGGGNATDWTWGCMAMKNEEIKELFDALPVGTKIKIEP